MSFTNKVQNQTHRPSDVQAFNFVVRHLVPCSVTCGTDGNDAFDSELKPSKCESIEALLESLIPKLNLPPSAVDCFHVLLATVIGLKINGPLLWTHCVGPSSGLKTTLLYMIAAAQDRCFLLSNFKGLYSGYKSATDTSVVPLLQGKVLIIPDLTPMLRADKAQQDEVFGDLRDIYDGKGNKIFKNGVQRSYSGVAFGCITGVTDYIRKIQNTDLGERFSMAEINASWDSAGCYHPESVDTSGEGNAFSAVLGTIASGLDQDNDEPFCMDNLAEERAMTWGLLLHLHEWVNEESNNLADLARSMQADKTFKAEVEALAQWLEVARCPVPKKNEETTVRQRPALPHRSIKILTKYAICLCVVNKTTVLTDYVRYLVRKIAFDTCHGHILEIMNYVAIAPVPQPKIDLACKMNLSPTRVAYLCDHLQELGVLEQVLQTNASGNRGAPAACYDLKPSFRLLADTIGLKRQAIRGTQKQPPKLRSLADSLRTPNPSLVQQGITKLSLEKQGALAPFPNGSQPQTSPPKSGFTSVFSKLRQQQEQNRDAS